MNALGHRSTMSRITSPIPAALRYSATRYPSPYLGKKFRYVAPMRDGEVPSQIVPEQLLGNISLAPVDAEQGDVQWCGWAKTNSVPSLREVAPENFIHRRDPVKPRQR